MRSPSILTNLLKTLLTGPPPSPPKPLRSRRAGTQPTGGWEIRIGEPRNAVLFVLGAVVILGGGRKLIALLRARSALAKLDDPNVTPEAIAEVAKHGRSGLMDLFSLLEKATDPAVRDSAGHAISVLWARDDLIAEEEKALVRRGFRVDWAARRRYPRALNRPIPVHITFGVPFLKDTGNGVRPDQLEWSHRVIGARRASLEVFGKWTQGEGAVTFDLVPADFETDGPHKLALQAKVRTVGLTEFWEIELPHIPFSFELDPRLDVEAILAMPDDSRAAAIAEAVRLAPPHSEEIDPVPRFFPINDDLAIRDLPDIEVTGALPCDLAHTVEIEVEDVPVTFWGGEVVVHAETNDSLNQSFPLGSSQISTPLPIDRPGTRRIRARLIPDPSRGWADPDVRSLWPRVVETGWVEVEVVRR